MVCGHNLWVALIAVTRPVPKYKLCFFHSDFTRFPKGGSKKKPIKDGGGPPKKDSKGEWESDGDVDLTNSHPESDDSDDGDDPEKKKMQTKLSDAIVVEKPNIKVRNNGTIIKLILIKFTQNIH